MKKFIAGMILLTLVVALLLAIFPLETWLLSDSTESIPPASPSVSPTPEQTAEPSPSPSPPPEEIPYDDTDSTKEPSAEVGQMTHLHRGARFKEDLADYINREVYPHSYKVRAVNAAVMNDFIFGDKEEVVTDESRVIFSDAEVAIATPEFKKEFATRDALWKQDEKTGEWVLQEGKHYDLTQNAYFNNTYEEPRWTTKGMGVAKKDSLCVTKAADGKYYWDVIVAIAEVETERGTYRMLVVIKTLCGNQWYAKAIKVNYKPPRNPKPNTTPSPTPTPTPSAPPATPTPTPTPTPYYPWYPPTTYTPTPPPTPKGPLYDPPDGGGEPNIPGDPPQATQDPQETDPIVPGVSPGVPNNPSNNEGAAVLPGGGTGDTHDVGGTPSAAPQDPSAGQPANNPETGRTGSKDDT